MVGRKEAQGRCGDKNRSVSFWCFVLFFGHAVGLAGSQFPNQGSELMHPAVEAQNPNHWTAREFPQYLNQRDGYMNLYM